MPNILLSVFRKSHAAIHWRKRVRIRCALSCDSPNGWGRHLSGRRKAGETEQSSFRLSNSGRWDRQHTKFCILSPMVDSKPVEFRGSALDELRAFPQAARREAGYQLDRVQHGREPED
jgi:hypothetical protein